VINFSKYTPKRYFERWNKRKERKDFCVPSKCYNIGQRTRRQECNSVTIRTMQSLWLKLQQYFIYIDFRAVDNQSHTYFHAFHSNYRRDTHRYLLLNVVRAVEDINAVHGMCLNIWIPSANPKNIWKESNFPLFPKSSNGIENMSKFLTALYFKIHDHCLQENMEHRLLNNDG
jgi:hypothetical protein